MGGAFLVVGAGVAGLACARELDRAGRSVLVLEKSRGVGGRCATRRVEGQPVDFGPVFLHGSDPAFLSESDGIPATTRVPWPARVAGSGPPCQPAAFEPGSQRFAYVEGVTAFPRRLAVGLGVRLEARVTSLAPGRDGLLASLETGESLAARDVVLALPVEQAAALLATLREPPPEVESARALLAMLGTVPCLALMAGYEPASPAPEWDVLYPEGSPVLQLVSHDSSKRPERPALVLVYQARPGWSRRHLEASPERWSAAILEEAARLLGPWASAPAWTRAHRWRHARTDRGNELAAPVLAGFPGGARLGLAGEAFSPGGGVEAAWTSGRRLARRLMGRDEP